MLTLGTDKQPLKYNSQGVIWTKADEKTAGKDVNGNIIQFDEYGWPFEKSINNQLITYNNL